MTAETNQGKNRGEPRWCACVCTSFIRTAAFVELGRESFHFHNIGTRTTFRKIFRKLAQGGADGSNPFPPFAKPRPNTYTQTTALQEKGSATEGHTQDVHEAILPFSSQQPSSESWRSWITPRPDLLESLDTDVIFCEQAVGGLLLAWGNRPKNEANIHTRASKS